MSNERARELKKGQDKINEMRVFIEWFLSTIEGHVKVVISGWGEDASEKLKKAITEENGVLREVVREIEFTDPRGHISFALLAKTKKAGIHLHLWERDEDLLAIHTELSNLSPKALAFASENLDLFIKIVECFCEEFGGGEAKKKFEERLAPFFEAAKM